MKTIIDMDNPPEEVKKWIKRLERCLTSAPKGVGLFFNSGSITAMATDEDNRIIMNPPSHSGGGVDREYVITNVKHKLSTAEGDW